MPEQQILAKKQDDELFDRVTSIFDQMMRSSRTRQYVGVSTSKNPLDNTLSHITKDSNLVTAASEGYHANNYPAAEGSDNASSSLVAPAGNEMRL